MRKGPIARRFDPTEHGHPLQPGPGSPNIFIEHQPAWRAVPIAVGQALLAAHQAANIAIGSRQAATDAAAGTPALPAAQTAEATGETAAAEAMAAAIEAVARASGADIHDCTTIYLVQPPDPIHPPGPAHGPGVVIDGSPTVMLNGLPAARVGDHVLESIGALDTIVIGSSTVIAGE